jgi:hypothetical protein
MTSAKHRMLELDSDEDDEWQTCETWYYTGDHISNSEEEEEDTTYQDVVDGVVSGRNWYTASRPEMSARPQRVHGRSAPKMQLSGK